ncbi:flavodoxin-like protein [Syncephalis pseudoplumigaleata]|uniref:Flavodoxin-like protein n=1 Tax=Syncephalis pseudoplumigaleata TaxID=1712513 RepID=A0A4P9YU05_9FUNG|nr:flavodoxin-like protein [Syncephalis pseudoplumigaleata]|eukprot:RKP23228.1 flavodoxin-like protein [Syncephalis pseudoplumigaleata]
MTATATIYIVYYSTYGHIHKLAKALETGAQRVKDVDIKLFRVPETLSDEILAKIHAPPKPEEVPVIEQAGQLTDADGFLFGFPTRFGMAPAQFKAFLDSSGGIWAAGALRGKQAGLFTSSNTQHGGQETTALTTLPFLAHHGLQYVPFGYGHPALNATKEVSGGSPYGASAVAGIDGDSPTKTELEIAEAQGEYFAKQVLIRKLGEKAFAEQQ